MNLHIAYYLAAFAAAFMLGLVNLAFPYLLERDLHCRPWQSGLCAGFSAVIYGTMCLLLAGRLNARFGHRRTSWLGLAVGGAGALGLGWWSTTFWRVFPALFVFNAGLAVFWPALQAALVEDRPNPLILAGRMRTFNAAWCSALVLGQIAGVSVIAVGDRYTTVLGGTALLVVSLPLLLFCAASRKRDPNAARALAGKPLLVPEAPGTQAMPPPMKPTGSYQPVAGLCSQHTAAAETLRLMGLWANLIFVVAAVTVRMYLPFLAGEETVTALWRGVIFGSLNGAQLGVFLALGVWRGWILRRWPIHLGLLLVGLGGTLPIVCTTNACLVAAFALVGAGGAMTYQASIYYSLFSGRQAESRSALHEAVIGFGGGLGPFAAGLIVDGAGWMVGEGHIPEAAYAFVAACAWVTCVGLLSLWRYRMMHR